MSEIDKKRTADTKSLQTITIQRIDCGDFFIDVPFNEAGQKDGIEITFDKRIQKVIESIPYKNDKRNGLAVSLFYDKEKGQDGRIETPYVDDKKDGTILWYTNGVVIREDPFKNDVRDGTVIDYKFVNSDRVLWAETSYKNGVKDGVAIEYCDDGKTIKKKTIWKNGELEPKK